MLTVFAPLWLWSAGAVAAAGAVALWRGRKNRRAVSSTLLWKEIANEAAGAKRRIADPLWILLSLAALLAGVAAAQPGWVSGEGPLPQMNLEIEARKMAGASEADLFLRVHGDILPDRMEIRAGEKSLSNLVWKNGIPSEGMVMKIPPAGHLEFDFYLGRQKIAARQADLITTRPLQLATFGQVPQPLRRIFKLQQRQSSEDGDDSIYVALMAAPAPGGRLVIPLYRVPFRDQLLIYNGDCPPQWLNPPTEKEIKFFPAPVKIESAGPSPMTMDAGVPIEFGGTVKRMRVMRPADDMQVILKAGGLPLVMIKRDDLINVTHVYLAVDLTPDDTDWPLDVSFPVFFSRLIGTMRQGGGGDFVDTWRITEVKLEQPEPKRTIGFAPWLAAASISLIAITSAALVRRATAKKK